MDFEWIETWLALPEFRVTGQVMRPHDLELHLERRVPYLVCPRCQGSGARIKEGRQRCLRDLPILDRPVTLRLHLGRLKCSDCHHRPWEHSETFGERVKWTERLYHQVRQEYLHGCPCHELASRYGLSARTVFRWTFEKSHGGTASQAGSGLGH
jgi:transposase